MKSLYELLTREIKRIQRARIASFFHPNEAAARQYADLAIGRFERHQLEQSKLPKPFEPDLADHPGGNESLNARLKRFGLRGEGNLRDVTGHVFVDSLKCTIETDRESPELFGLDIYLVAGLMKNGRASGRRWQLNFEFVEVVSPGDLTGQGPRASAYLFKLHPHFEPGTTDDFVIDTAGGVALEEVTGFALQIGPDQFGEDGLMSGRYSKVWMPKQVTLEINGVAVLNRRYKNRRLTVHNSLDLEFPSPFTPDGPVVKAARLTVPSPVESPDAIVSALAAAEAQARTLSSR